MQVLVMFNLDAVANSIIPFSSERKTTNPKTIRAVMNHSDLILRSLF